MGYGEKLRAFNQRYQAATEATGNVPNGKYRVIVDRAELKESNQGVLRLSWKLLVTEGPYMGRTIYHSNRIVDDETALGYLKADIRRAGLTIDDLSQLEDCLMDFDGRILDIELRAQANNPQYQNCYIQKFVGMGDPNRYCKKAISTSDPTPMDIAAEGDLPF